MNKWEFQGMANKLAFLTAEEYSSRREILERIIPALEKTKSIWGLSCSANLFFSGLVDDFNDFDILIRLEDIEIVKKTIAECGIQLLDTVQKRCFSSPYYQEATIGDVHFDLVGDITINTFRCSYQYSVREEDIIYTPLEGGINIPQIPVEASLILYGMMEGWQAKRKFKREACREYLQKNGVQYPHILEDAADQGLPDWLQEIVAALL